MADLEHTADELLRAIGVEKFLLRLPRGVDVGEGKACFERGTGAKMLQSGRHFNNPCN